MKINATGNLKSNKQNFGGAYIIDVPKSFYPKGVSDFQVALDFKAKLDVAISQKPRKFMTRVLNATGINPIAEAFMHYPGYGNIQKYMENGIDWAKSRINFRYRLGNNGIPKLNFPLPQLGKENYRFYLLTGKEKEKFWNYEPQLKKHFGAIAGLIAKSIEANNGERMEFSDKLLLRDLSDACGKLEAFNSACGPHINDFEMTSKEELPSFLNKCVNVWH